MPGPPNGSTLLVVAPFGLPPFSARGITQTLTPINLAQNLRRTVNGGLVSLAPPQFRKYASKISCHDVDAPAIDGVFPGLAVTVDCVAELAYRTIGGTQQRPVVDGSLRTEGDFTFYRPRLEMLVVSVSTQQEEWAAAVAWSLDLEEI